MKVLFGMNSIMSMNNLPSIEHYCSTDNYMAKQGLRDDMTKSRFKEILCNIHFSDMIQLNPMIKVIKLNF